MPFFVVSQLLLQWESSVRLGWYGRADTANQCLDRLSWAIFYFFLRVKVCVWNEYYSLVMDYYFTNRYPYYSFRDVLICFRNIDTIIFYAFGDYHSLWVCWATVTREYSKKSIFNFKISIPVYSIHFLVWDLFLLKFWSILRFSRAYHPNFN